MNFKVFLLIFVLPIFLSKYPPIFTDISDISVKSKYRYIRNYRYFVPCLQVQGACEETVRTWGRFRRKPGCGFGVILCTCIRMFFI